MLSFDLRARLGLAPRFIVVKVKERGIPVDRFNGLLMNIKKGDTVKVLSGEYKGKQSKVLKVFPDKGTCIVEGVNFRTKHKRPTQPGEQAGRVKQEGPILFSNLKLICPKCGVPTKIGKKEVKDVRVRVCKKCGEMIDA